MIRGRRQGEGATGHESSKIARKWNNISLIKRIIAELVAFTEYGRLVLVLVGCMLFIAFVTNPLIAFANTRNDPYPLVLRCLKDSGITAFFTRSSTANIPFNMELCRKPGLDEDNYSASIPLDAIRSAKTNWTDSQ